MGAFDLLQRCCLTWDTITVGGRTERCCGPQHLGHVVRLLKGIAGHSGARPVSSFLQLHRTGHSRSVMKGTLRRLPTPIVEPGCVSNLSHVLREYQEDPRGPGDPRRVTTLRP